MIAGLDYVGLSTLITALGTIVIGVVVALRQNGVKNNVQEVHDQIQVKGASTLGELTDHVHEVVCGESEPGKVTP